VEETKAKAASHGGRADGEFIDETSDKSKFVR
jgi:hypothetical protein